MLSVEGGMGIREELAGIPGMECAEAERGRRYRCWHLPGEFWPSWSGSGQLLSGADRGWG